MKSLISSPTTWYDLESRPFDSLPPELVCRILSFLGPRDVVRLRLVSKLFHGITYDPVIWKTIYANARLPRPPGPFPSQSTRFLEQTLIRSERLAKCWTTQPIQAISSTQIQLGGLPLGQPRIIGGRWIIAFESYRRIVFHDVETRSRQAVWEDTALITSWDACSVTFAGGLLVYVIFRKNPTETWRTPWKLLEFRVHSESGHLSHSVSLDVPARSLGKFACLVGDKAPFLYIMGQHLVLDTRTRIFYEFPEFSSELHKIQADLSDLFLMTSRKVFVTNTHIVVVFNHLKQLATPSSTSKSTLVQVFTPPADPHPGSGTGILRLSHEGIIADDLVNLTLIRNSTIDSVTEFTSLRFLRLEVEGDRLFFSCVDVTLPKSNYSTILPASIDVNHIFTVESGIHDPFISPYGYYVAASDDGHVRGFCRNRLQDDRLNAPCITKFTIDAAGDKCITAVGQASPPRWIHNEDPPCFSVLSFDGGIGKFCDIKSGDNWRLHGLVDAVVVDIK